APSSSLGRGPGGRSWGRWRGARSTPTTFSATNHSEVRAMYRILYLIGLYLPAALFGLMVPGAGEAQTWRTMSSARQVWDTSPLEVEIQYGAGRLEVLPAEAPLLYEMEIRYDERAFRPIAEYDEDDGQLRLGVESERDRRGMNVREGSSARIALTREVPLDLDLEFGAGEATI